MGQRGGRQRVSLLIVVTAQTVVRISDSVLKRCPPSAARIASPQQKGAQLRVVELKHIVKGRLTFVVFRVHISSSVKQKRAQLCLFHENSIVQGCAAPAVLRIRVSPAAEKKGAQLRGSPAHSKVKRCCALGSSPIISVAFGTLSIHVGPAVEQKLADLGLFFGDSNMKSCATLLALGLQVSPSVEQEDTELYVAVTHAGVKRQLTFPTLGVHISSPLKQNDTMRCMFNENGSVKRCVTITVSIVHISSSVKQKRAKLCVSCADSNVQRRPSEIALLRIHIGPAAEKKGAQLRASPVYSKVKRCCAVAQRPVREIMALSIHVGPAVEKKLADLDDFFSNDSNMKRRATRRSGLQVSSSVEQEGTQLGVLLLNSHVKSFADARVVGPNIAGRIAAALLRVHDAGIKIQPAETHVSALYRGEKRRVVDGTTLLAQRGNSTRSQRRSTRSQRRHSIDAAPL